MRQKRKKEKKIKFALYLKIISAILFCFFAFLIWNFDRFYHFFPSRYRLFFEQANDAIFGKVQIIEITGNKLVSRDEVLSHIYNADVSDDDINLINSEAKIIQSLKQNPVIDFVSIRRFLPNKMVVHIKEKPLIMRFWDVKTSEFFSITRSGEVVRFDDSRLKIPLILGDFEITDVLKIYNTLDNAGILPDVTQIFSFFEYRFDVVLKNKLLVNLPEDNAKEAIFLLKKLIVENSILEKNIKQVDLRVKNKIFITRFSAGEPEKYSPPASYTVLSW